MAEGPSPRARHERGGLRHGQPHAAASPAPPGQAHQGHPPQLPPPRTEGERREGGALWDPHDIHAGGALWDPP